MVWSLAEITPRRSVRFHSSVYILSMYVRKKVTKMLKPLESFLTSDAGIIKRSSDGTLYKHLQTGQIVRLDPKTKPNKKEKRNVKKRKA